MTLIIIISFTLGIILGSLCKVRLSKKINLLNITVIFLLFSMGTHIGSDKDLLKALPEIGTKGLLIASFSAGCSITFNWFFEHFTRKDVKQW